MYGATDATGTAASFAYPSGITIDGGNLYVVDKNNHKIRKIVISTGVVTTLAGSGMAGAVNATGAAASFNYPSGITSDGVSLYIADESNHKIRMIAITSGAVTTLAGSGTAGSTNDTGTASSFSYPGGIITDGTNLYVADTGNHKIRKILIASGAVTTLAGSGTAGSVNATGAAASFTSPTGVTTDGTNLYVADTGNHKIRRIVIASGAVSTWAGTGIAGVIDGTGATASFFYPLGLTTVGGKLFVSDYIGHTIRKIQ
jgi:sugar lactone lactonase YvrE